MDYTDYERGGTESNRVGRWWKGKDDEEVARALCDTAKRIRDQQVTRRQLNLRHERLYGNFDLAGFGPTQYAAEGTTPQGNWISLNLVAACVDTVVAKIGKSRPRPSYQTFGGDWKLQRKASKLDKFTQGAFDDAKVYVAGRDVLADACKFGTGVPHVYVDDDTERIRVERVLPDEMLVDDSDAVNGTPRALQRQRPIARDLALELWGRTPEAKTALASASSSPT